MSRETDKKTSKKRRNHTIEWEKLDNTANLFPAIATQNMTNVYRISVTLKEEIQGAVLQLALDKVLERFDTFRVRMRSIIREIFFPVIGNLFVDQTQILVCDLS